MMKTEQEIKNLLKSTGISSNDIPSAIRTVNYFTISDEERTKMYIQFLEAALSEDELKNIRRASGFQGNWVLG